jgi:hypothetical protein
MVKPVAETPQPRGEISLVGGPAAGVVFSARVVTHLADTRREKSNQNVSPP